MPEYDGNIITVVSNILVDELNHNKLNDQELQRMNANAVKNGIRTILKNKEILVSKITFSKVESKESCRKIIGKIEITLDDVSGVQLDVLKSSIDDYLYSIGIDYYGLSLDI